MNWLSRFIETLDVFLNVALLDGEVEETISMHAAKSAAGGHLWACWLCRFLSAVIERNHCTLTLEGKSISPRGGVIAGVLLVGLFALLTGTFWWIVF